MAIGEAQGKDEMERKHAGAHNELLATLWLLKQGYEIFRNVSFHGHIDFIAMKEGETLFIDVKSAHYRGDGSMYSPALKQAQIDKGVVCLRVFPDGKCSFDMKPPVHGASNYRNCLQCNEPFKPIMRIHQYCSSPCRIAHWQQNKSGAELEAAE